jgi:hypothetical protein
MVKVVEGLISELNVQFFSSFILDAMGIVYP